MEKNVVPFLSWLKNTGRNAFVIAQPWVMAFCVIALLAGFFFTLSRPAREWLHPRLFSAEPSELGKFAALELSAQAVRLAAAEDLVRQKWPLEQSAMGTLTADEQTELGHALHAALHVLSARSAPATATEESITQKNKASTALETNESATPAPAPARGSDTADTSVVPPPARSPDYSVFSRRDRAGLLGTLRQAQVRIAECLAKNHDCDALLLPAPRQAAQDAENERLKNLPARLITPQKLKMLHLCAVFGAFGAGLQGLWSIAIYAGNRRYRGSWNLFYLARPLVGAGLAVAFCFLIEGGFVNIDTADDRNLSLYGFGAVALVIGLFMGEAMEKLRLVAAAIFNGNDKYADGLGSSAPLVEHTNVTPDHKDDGTFTDWRVRFRGQRLNPVHQVLVAGKAHEPVFNAAGEPEIRLPAKDHPVGSSVDVVLVRLNPDPAISEKITVNF